MSEAKDELYRIGLNDDSEVNPLTAYYRHRINRFEQERLETIKHIERIKVSVEEKHRAEWDIQRSKEIVAELQKSLSDARTKLYDERQITLKLKAENDSLIIRTTQDSQKIHELVGIVEPVQQNIVLAKDKMPGNP
jgi:coiled-coil domain-containing protein 77